MSSKKKTPKPFSKPVNGTPLSASHRKHSGLHGGEQHTGITDAPSANKTDTSKNGCVPRLVFPEQSVLADLTPHLSALNDSHSTHDSVTKSCLHLSQFSTRVGSPDTEHDNGTNGIASSILVHDATYAATVSSAMAALMDCIQNHDDRRCRIVASKTLAVFGRSAYAQIRHTPLLFSTRDGTLHRLEDEVGTDVSVALATVALDDVDDGVSACAVEALGMLALTSSSCSLVGTLVDDELLREIETIANARFSSFSPSLSQLPLDEDPSVPCYELQCRIYENVLSPRLWRLVHRISLYESCCHMARTLPFLTACLVHVVKINPAKTFGIDRTTYAKQWMELDVSGLVHDFVHLILIPAMETSFDSSLAYAAALSSLRLAHVCCNATWVANVCQLAVVVCTEQLAGAQVLEHKTSILGALLVALRGIPVRERLDYLVVIANEVRFFPSTTTVPFGVTSPGMLLDQQQQVNGSCGTCYRTPARIGFLTEIALSLFVDGPTSSYREEKERSCILGSFLVNSVVSSIMSARSCRTKKKRTSDDNDTPSESFLGLHVAEELVFCFCTIASAAGRCLMVRKDGSAQAKLNQHYELEEWLRCSLVVLSSFSQCLNWRSRILDTEMDNEDLEYGTLFTLGIAAQAAYVRLLQECLYAMGLILPNTSVSLTVMPRETPIGAVVLEQLASSALSISNYQPASVGGDLQAAKENMQNLMEQFLEYKLREGLPSRHMRIFVLALLTDHWVQLRQVPSNMFNIDSGVAQGRTTYQNTTNLDDIHARELLANLSAEISIEKEIALIETGYTQEMRPNKHTYLSVCVACVENIALTTCDLKRKIRATTFGSIDNSFLSDFEDDANYILSTAMTVLRGQNLRSKDDSDDDKEQSKELEMLPLCEQATKRIEAANSINSPVKDGTAWGLEDNPTLFSTLVMERDVNSSLPEAASRQNRVDAPLVNFASISQTLTSNEYCYAYMSLYCQQSVLSRIDASFLSSSMAGGHTRSGSAGDYGLRRSRPRNWLRLTPPPLPSYMLGRANETTATRLSLFSSSTSTVTAGSDPVSVVLAHVVRRCPRYDYESEYKLTITMRIYNVTAVELANGLRMELGVSQAIHRADADVDHISKDIARALHTEESVDDEKTFDDNQLVTVATTIYKQHIAAGDHLTWEISLETLPTEGSIVLHPSVTFCNMETEQSTCSWARLDGAKDDEGTDKTDGGIGNFEDNADEFTDIRLAGESISLSPMIVLQPCPLVFFRGSSGDMDTFRFLWLNAPCKIPSLKLREPESNVDQVGASTDEVGHAIAAMSSVCFSGENSNGEEGTKVWAFMSLSGKRVLCVIRSSPTQYGDAGCTLYIRGDDKNLLLSLFGSQSARTTVIYSLTSAAWICSIDGENGKTLGEV